MKCGLCGERDVQVPWRVGHHLPDEIGPHVLHGPKAVFVPCEPGEESGVCGACASKYIDALWAQYKFLDEAHDILMKGGPHEYKPQWDRNACLVCGRRREGHS